MKKALIPIVIGVILQSTTLFGSVCDDKLANCGSSCPTSALSSGQIRLNITDNGNRKSKILNSLTVSGTSYGQFIPQNYLGAKYAVKNHSHYIVNNGSVSAFSNQSGYQGYIESAFKSTNLNYYHSNGGEGNKDGDIVKILYKNLIKSTGDRYIVLTERCGNNPQYIFTIDSNGHRVSAKKYAKSVYTAGASNYFSTGHYVNDSSGQQTLYTAIWPLTAFAKEGKNIAGFAIEQIPSRSLHSTDAGDGKALLFVKKGSLSCNIVARNDSYPTPLIIGNSTPSVLVNDDADGKKAKDSNIHNNIKITNFDGLPSGTTISTSGKIKIVSGTKTGTYRPTYRICLAKDINYCDTAIVTLKVQNKPHAINDSRNTDQGLSILIDVLSNDEHTDKLEIPKLIIKSVDTASHGTTAIDRKGTATPIDDEILYTPNAGYFGKDTFKYTIKDSIGQVSTATVTITITKAPNTVISDATIMEGGFLVFDFRIGHPYAANITYTLKYENNTTDDNDHEGRTTELKVVMPAGKLLTKFRIKTIDDPIDEVDSENLTLSIVSSDSDIGDINDTGIGYILDNDFSPIAVNDSDKTDQGLPVNVKVLKNDSHPTKGEKIKIVSSTPGANGTTSIDDKGTVNTEDDEIIYLPNNSFSGVDTFNYTIEDLQGNQDTATVTITIRQAPSILIADATIPEGGMLSFFVTLSHPYGKDIKLDLDYENNTTNDKDHEGKLNKFKITIPKGKLLVKFRLKTIDDLLVESQSENLTLKMVSVNPSFLPITDTAIGYILDNDFAPVAYDDYVPGVNGEPTTICVLRNDLDGTSDINKYTLRILDNNSSVTSLTVPNEGTWEVNNDSGCITFTPNDDYVGDPKPIKYYVEDEGTNSVTATAVINYPPLAIPDELIAKLNEVVTITVLDNDRETNSSINKNSVKLIDGNLKEQNEIYIDGKGIFSVNDGGSVTFTPDVNFDGEVNVPYTFKEVEGDVSNKAIITILYPILRDDLLLSKYIGGHKESFDILSNDSKNIYDISLITKGNDIKREDSKAKLATDSNGTKLITKLSINKEGTWSLKGSVITFTPDEEFFGNPTPIRYTAKLKGYQIDAAKITIIYKKSGPLALDNLGIPVTNYNSLVLNVLNNDDFGLHGSGKKKMIWTKPKHGRIIVNEKGTPYNTEDDVLVYKAKSVDYYGTDEFMYTITDARGQTSTARVTLNVACSSSQPTDGAGVSKYLFLLLFPFILLFRRRKSI